MIDIVNGLRRIAEEGYRFAGDAADEIERLRASLEAAEKEGDTMRTKISDLTINAEYLGNLKKSYEELIGELQDDRDALRAKIERMEQQEPVSWADAFGEPFRKKSEIDGVASPLYALPGAKGE